MLNARIGIIIYVYKEVMQDDALESCSREEAKDYLPMQRFRLRWYGLFASTTRLGKHHGGFPAVLVVYLYDLTGLL